MAETDKNGQHRCPKCGATDVALDVKSGKLKCNFCRTLFDNESANESGGIENLTNGREVSEGASNIVADEAVILTIKCSACGADIVINTDEATNARCHWCRHVLSINEKQPNGAVPDLVLPFSLEKNKAVENIRDFVKERQFFMHPKFKAEFNLENVMGVYLPYMVIDANSHAHFDGEAEHQTRKYTVGSGNSQRTYYDADVYNVSREFDLLVDDLTIEASRDKIHQNTAQNSNNVINAIMPFDTDKAVAWDARYLRGFASEKRDVDSGELAPVVKEQVTDIARYKARETMKFYDRGVKWNNQKVDVKGSRWKAAYLPVWLYSYMEVKDNKKLLHYVAVNARTGETSGSVPIYKAKLMAFAVLVEILGIIVGFTWLKFWLIDADLDSDDDNPALLGLVGLTPGFIFYWLKTNKYRSLSARHTYEKDTKAEVKNLTKTDTLREKRTRLSNSRIAGENGNTMKGILGKGADKMMGEKMADYLGIDKMVKK